MANTHQTTLDTPLPSRGEITDRAADGTARLLFIGLVIGLVAFSSYFVLSLNQSKEYLASAFERATDPATLTHQGVIEWQVAMAIATMLLQMLICASVCAAYKNQVQDLIDDSHRLNIPVRRIGWLYYFLVLVVVILCALPFAALANSIGNAYCDVLQSHTGNSGDKACSPVGDINPKDLSKLEGALWYYQGSVYVSGTIAFGFLVLYWFKPKVGRAITLALCSLSVVLAAIFHVLGMVDPDSFRWIGAFALVFVGGAVIWGAVYIGLAIDIPPKVKFIAIALVVICLVIKFTENEYSPLTPHVTTATLDADNCPPAAREFARIEIAVLKELRKNDIIGDIEASKCRPLAQNREAQTQDKEYFARRRAIRAQQAEQRAVIKDTSDQDIAASYRRAGELYEQNSERIFGLPNFDQKIARWLQERRAEIDIATPDKPYRIYIATTQGGGLYAAYHGAMALARLQDQCPEFGRQLFAISAVSGGAVGAQLFSDLIYRSAKARAQNGDQAISAAKECTETTDQGPFQKAVEEFFLTDFQAPLIGKLLYSDLPLLLLPRWFTRTDRANALDGAFESGFDSLWQKMRSASDGSQKSIMTETHKRYYFTDAAAVSHSAPSVVINAALANNGMPVILAPFYFSNFYEHPTSYGETAEADAANLQPSGVEREWAYFRFAHFYDVMPGIDVPLMTAVLLGARFPYVTPGGRFLLRLESRKKLYKSDDIVLADGGYFDNTGTASAIAMALRIKEHVNANQTLRGRIRVALVRMVDHIKPAAFRLQRSPNELLLPLSTVYQSRLFKRDFYGRLMRGDITEIYDLPFDPADVGVPLSWQLSRSARKRIDQTINLSLLVAGDDSDVDTIEPGRPSVSPRSVTSPRTSRKAQALPRPVKGRYNARPLLRQLRVRPGKVSLQPPLKVPPSSKSDPVSNQQ